MKIRPVGAQFFHADGQTDRQTDGWTANRETDMTKLIVAFRIFANGPKKFPCVIVFFEEFVC